MTMERKIGEIFEYKDEWYQCVEGDSCGECSFFDTACGSGTKNDDDIIGTCSGARRDKSVIFKKLKKVGEPYKLGEVLIQQYQGIIPVVLPDDSECSSIFRVIMVINIIEIIVKQNQKDMEEKTQLPKEDNPLTRLVYNYVNGKISDKEFIKSIKELPDKYPYTPSLKKFDLEAAKAGKPVCTRDGRKARIICFDKHCVENNALIVACVTSYNSNNQEFEDVIIYKEDGTLYEREHPFDLMMLPEKHEGWVNIVKKYGREYVPMTKIYNTRDEALKEVQPFTAGIFEYIDTVKIEWEE